MAEKRDRKAKPRGLTGERSVHTSRTGTMAFSADGRRLVFKRADTVVLWDVGSWGEMDRFEPPKHARMISEVAFSTDGRQILGAGDELCIWDIATRSLAARAVPPGTIRCFSPDGRFLLIANGPLLALVDVQSGERLLQAPAEFPLAVGFSWNGGHLLSVHADGALCSWSVVTGAQVERRLIPLEIQGNRLVQWGYLATFSADGRALCLEHKVSHDPPRYSSVPPGSAWLQPDPIFETREIVYLGLDTNSAAQVVVSGADTARPICVALAPVSRSRLLLWQDDRLRLWDTTLQAELCTFEAKHVCGLALSHDALLAATATTDGKLQLWTLPEQY